MLESLLIFLLFIEVSILGIMLVMIYKMAKLTNLKIKEAEKYFLDIQEKIETKFGKYLS